MRLLPDRQRRRLLDEICTYARRYTEFLLPDCELHIQVISGETEGLYGWIAANYLLGGFDDPVKHAHGKGHHTYGFLDMGGASAQIAFAPNVTEAEKHAEDLALLRMRKLDGSSIEFGVFVTTWLGFGVNQARKRYVEKLVEASGGDGILELPDPCLPVGLKVTLDGKELDDVTKPGKDSYLIGTGKFEECLSQTYPLLAKDGPCEEISCLLTGKHAPAIDFDINHFVGVSEYWHTTHEIFEIDHPTKSYDLDTYQTRVKEFCGQDWSHIEDLVESHKWGKKVDSETAMQVCFKASWLINVLHNGIGIPRVGIETSGNTGKHNITEEVIEAAKDKGFLDPFQPVDKIGDVEVSWTLGKMVLYAASKVPPKDDTVLAVGFGSNNPAAIKTLPADFEYASSPAESSPYHLPPASANTNYSMDGSTDPTYWHENLWREGDKVPRRIPGILLFLIIFCIAGFLLMGRERRGKIWHTLKISSKKGKRKILGSSGGITYERVMEEGGDAMEFELGSVSSSDDDDGGWKGKSGLYDPPMGSAGASGVRSGMGRVGSRERLPVVTRSRNVSPSRDRTGAISRARSPLPPRI